MEGPRDRVTVHYDERLIREAVRHYVWRRYVAKEQPLWIASAILLVVGTGLWVGGSHSGWTAGTIASAFLCPAFVLFAWWARLQSSLRVIRRMPVPTAEWTFDGDGVTTASSRGEMRVPWSVFTNVWAYPRYWLLFFEEEQFVILPTQELSPDLIDRLARWVGERLERS